MLSRQEENWRKMHSQTEGPKKQITGFLQEAQEATLPQTQDPSDCRQEQSNKSENREGKEITATV